MANLEKESEKQREELQLKAQYNAVKSRNAKWKITLSVFMEKYPKFIKNYKGYVRAPNGLVKKGLDPWRAFELGELHGYDTAGILEDTRQQAPSGRSQGRASSSGGGPATSADSQGESEAVSKGKEGQEE